MSKKPARDQAWQDCPSGTLDALVQHGQMKRRRQTTGKILAISTASCLALVAYALVFTNPAQQPARLGGLTCDEVDELMPDFESGRVSPEVAARIRTHLDHCPDCGDKIAEAASHVTIASPGARQCSCQHDCGSEVDPLGRALIASGIDPPSLVSKRIRQLAF